jgi:hypothetical protein
MSPTAGAPLGEALADGLTDALGLMEAEAEALGDIDADGD